MRKSYRLLTIMTMFVVNCLAQSPEYDWTKTLETSGTNRPYDIIIDQSNNVYYFGNYSGTVDLDFGTGIDNHTALGSDDICVVKTDVSGNFIWGKSFGGYGIDIGKNIALDSSGALYLVGQYYDSISYDNGVSVDQHISNGAGDVFILKLDTLGNVLWSKSIGGLYGDEVSAIETTLSGNIYISGSFNATVDFDPGPLIDNHTTNGSLDGFLLSLNANGEYLWVKTFGGTGIDRANCMTIDLNENILIGGMYNATVDFDPGTSIQNETTIGLSDMFVLKLTPTGDFNWVRTFGSNSGESIGAITCDLWNNVITTGAFTGSIDFDPGLNSDIHTSLGANDIFIHKLDQNGNYIWAKTIGSTHNEVGSAVCTDDLGNIYTTGSHTRPMDFDPNSGIDIHQAYISGALSDIFIQKMNSNGDYQWARTCGHMYNDAGLAVVILNPSLIFIAGTFCGNVDFNPYGAADVHFSNGSDLFIQRLNQCDSFTSSSLIIETCNGYTSPSGNYYWTTDGIYSDTIFNSVFCDSIITIDLTILESSNYVDQHEVCDSLQWINGITYYNSTNSPTWILMNSIGCDSIITLDLTINSVDSSITLLDQFSIQAESAGAQYQWLDCDSDYAQLSGETGQAFIAIENGNYAVMITENGCTDTSACIGINAVEIIEFDFGIHPIIFPNPTDGSITVMLPSTNEAVTVEIFDIYGKIVSAQSFYNTGSFDLSIDGAAGVYYIHIISNSAFERMKILKK